MMNDTQQRADSRHRSFLPRRSRGDRKLAGVAGGLGRAFGIDPVLIRVAFVVLTIFGGSGVLLYCLGWLLMPADGDEVSAIEALAGRGRSSVSTALTVVLIIVALSSAGSMFSWGLPFWPVVIAAIVVFLLVRHGQAGSCNRASGREADWGRRAGSDTDWGRGAGSDTDWGRRADEFAERAAAWGERAGERAQRWADEWTGRWSQGRGRGGRDWNPGGPPAAGWAAPDPATRQPGTPAAGTDAAGDGPTGESDASAGESGAAAGPTRSPDADFPADGRPTGSPSPEDLLTGGRPTPPAWDPLGVAPFAWDLPDPTPEPAETAAGPARGRGVPGRLFLGLALLTAGLLAGGVFAGWWALSWAAVAGITLAVVGFGLLVSSLRGSGGRSLIGPGIFLALLTLALTVTGITGTTGYGQQTWTPRTVADVQDSYHWNAGQATLDLTRLQIDKGQTVTTDLTVNGGQATVLVPQHMTVNATCSANVGNVNCLDGHDDGVRPEATGSRTGAVDSGTLTIEVHSNAGQVEVRTRG